MTRRRTETTVIVGAGIAGAATAYFLARRGRKVVLLEREELPGTHSSGRNAAILRTFVGEPAHYRLACESLSFYGNLPADFSLHPVLNPVGLILGAAADGIESLVVSAGEGLDDPDTVEIDPKRLPEKIPILEGEVLRAIHRPTEGVLDIHGIMDGFLRGARNAGTEILLGEGEARLEVSGGRIAGVRTRGTRIAAEKVVIAGGGWAESFAAAAGLGLPLVPFRRHLLATAPLRDMDASWPVVWIAGDEFYFRPESGGLLICACDTVPISPELGETVDPDIFALLDAKVARWIPAVSDLPALRLWAGMRTFAPDNKFVIGPDPRLEGLFWVAGLGGHGMTCAPAVGSLAADWIADGRSSHPSAAPLAPARLL